MFWRNYELVVFDFDDTIVAANAHRRQLITDFASANAGDQVLTKFDLHYGLPLREFLSELNIEVGSGETWERYKRAVSANPAPMLPGVPALLQELNSVGTCVSILSSSWTELIEIELESLGIRRFVSEIFGSDSDIPAKPQPAALQSVVHRLIPSGSTKRTIYVGDSLTDLSMAVGAGIDFLAVCTGITKPIEFLRAGLPKLSICQTLEAVRVNADE